MFAQKSKAWSEERWQMTVRGTRVSVYILGRVYTISTVFSSCSSTRRTPSLAFKEWAEHLDWLVRTGAGNLIRKPSEVQCTKFRIPSSRLRQLSTSKTPGTLTRQVSSHSERYDPGTSLLTNC